MVATRARLRYSSPMTVLARVRFGVDRVPHDAASVLTATVPSRPLADGPAEEIWPAVGAVTSFLVGDAPAAADDRSAFVTIESRDGAGAEIDELTRDLYGRLLSGIEDAGHPHLLRVWNYVPRIHEEASGLDRYMHFCRGRS